MKKSLKYSFNTLIFIAVGFATISCTREAQKSTSYLTIQFPSSNQSGVTAVETANKGLSEKPNFDYNIVPASYEQIDCLLVFVGGPEDTMRNNYCEKSADKSQNFKFGVFAGAVSKNQTVSLEVPSGSSRYVRLYGMKKPNTTALCPSIAADGADDLLSGFSTPYFLGESRPTEMAPGATVTVPISIVAAIDSNAYFDDCGGAGFGPGNGGGGGSTQPSRPYLRIEGLHNFNKIENPSFARAMARGACYPITFKTFKPCNGGLCEAYVLQNPLTINFGSNFKFFGNENDCRADNRPLSQVVMSAGQSQVPATGQYYMRMPIGQIGITNTNLSNDISITTTAEVNFDQPAYTNIDVSKPKIVFSNLPASITYGGCAAGTNSTISVYEDSAGTIPMNSHQIFPFDSQFLIAKTVGCGTQISAISSNLSTLTVNLAKPAATVSGVTGTSVNTIAFDSVGNKYYIAGLFTAYGGKSVGNIIRLNSNGGYDHSFDSGIGFDGPVYSVVPDGIGGVYVAGSFSNYKGIAVKSLARLDQNGKLDLTFGFDFDGPVYTMKLDGTNLIFGGGFTLIDVETRNYIASLDIVSKAITSWTPNADNVVKALAIDASKVFVGGYFNNIGGLARSKIASLDSTTGLALPWNPGSNNNVLALNVIGTSVFVGGQFTTIAGQPRNRIAELNSSTGVATAWNPSADAAVNAIEIMGSNVFVGGPFSNVGGASRAYVAAVNISTGVATSWNPNLIGSNVFSIKANGSSVVFGGIFSSAGGATANKVAAVDNSVGSLVATELNPYWGTLVFNPTLFDYLPFNISQ